MPVLDSDQHLQLHGAIDMPFNPAPKGKGKASSTSNPPSSVFWLDRKVVGDAMKKVLQEKEKLEGGEEDALRRRAKDILDEGWDLFVRVVADGSVLVTAVAVRYSNSLDVINLMIILRI